MTESYEQSVRVAQALAHPVRLHILELLRAEGAYVMHLAAALERPQANISQHLAILREAGLVQDERDGMAVVYRVADPRIFDVIARMQALNVAPQTPRALMAFDSALPRGRRARGCHCPRCRGDRA